MGMRLGLIAAAASALGVIIQAAPGRAEPAIGCDGDCARLLDHLPDERPAELNLDGRSVADLSDSELCELLVEPSTSGRRGWCRFAATNSRRLQEFETGDTVFSLDYDRDAIEITDSLFLFTPDSIFAKQLQPFLPCYVVYSANLREGHEIIELDTVRHPYFEKFPNHEQLFTCHHLPSGWGLEPSAYHLVERGVYPYWASPFSIPTASEHVATILTRPSNVRNGGELLRVIGNAARDAALRREICGAIAEGDHCWAPREISIRDGSYADEVLAFCAHEVALGELMPPKVCSVFAVWDDVDGEWLVRALVSPDTYFPSGDGVGDASIDCSVTRSGSWRSQLERKFPVSLGYTLTDKLPWRIIRKGFLSEVYPQLREMLVISVSELPDAKISLTPTIYFSYQNVQNQEEYRPISDLQYDFYVQALISRMAPELVCQDRR